MAEPAIKLPIKTETTSAPQVTKASDWQPFEALRNQVDRLFHDFQTGFLRAPSYRSLLDIEPFWRRDFGFDVTPAIDIVEKDKAFELTAELPGLDVKNIDLQLSDNVLTIKGESRRKGRETKDRRSERRYGSFRRCWRYLAVSTPTRSKRAKSGVRRSPCRIAEAQKKQKTIPAREVAELLGLDGSWGGVANGTWAVLLTGARESPSGNPSCRCASR
jgi:HSP20 family protein